MTSAKISAIEAPSQRLAFESHVGRRQSFFTEPVVQAAQQGVFVGEAGVHSPDT